MSGAVKRFLFIVRQGPGPESRIGEALDMLMTIAAFDQPVTVLFVDEGILHLAAAAAEQPERDDPTRAILRALPLYDINEILVGLESLAARGFSERDLHGLASVQCETRIPSLIAEHDVVLVN
jgi:tRNA 2-thiouridine synthesizing protein C